MRSLLLWLILCPMLLAEERFGTTIEVTPTEAIMAKSATVEPQGDKVAVFFVDREDGSRHGLDIAIISVAKWVMVDVEDMNTGESVEVSKRSDGVRYFFGPVGKYRLQVVEFDPELGPNITKRIVEIKKVGTKPPPDTPPPTTGKLYFMVVRNDGQASPAFTKIMSNPAWIQLMMDGYLVKDKTVTEATAGGFVVPQGTKLPVVLTLRVSADWKKSTVVGLPRALPDNEADILKLKEVQ